MLLYICTKELQWLEHLWDHGNLFEIWVVPLKVSHGAKVRKRMSIFREVFSIFYIIMVCFVYSFESPR